MNEPRKPIQITLPSAIWQEFREHCVRYNLRYNQTVEALIKAYLAGPKK